MPRFFSNEELNQRREQIRKLNETGQGLTDRATRLQLEKLQNYFQYAAAAMEKDLGDKITLKQKELVLYLREVAKSFQKLTRDNILEGGEEDLVKDRHSDFEMALRTLSDLPEKLLDREPDGTLVFDRIHKYGRSITENDRNGKQLLGEIDNLDRILDLGLGGLAKNAEVEQSEMRKRNYLIQGQVLRFQTNPDALIAAELTDPGSEVSGVLLDFISALNRKPKFRDSEFMQCALSLHNLAVKAADETEPFARRELIVRAAQQVGLLRQMYEAYGFADRELELYRTKKNVVFPPKLEGCMVDHGREILKRYFTPYDERVREQLKTLETPGVLLPAEEKNSLPRMAALLSENPKEITTADLALLRGTYWLVSKFHDSLPKGAFRNSVYTIGRAMQDIVVFYDKCDEDTNEESLKKVSDAFRDRCETIDSELAKLYESATPQEVETLHGIFDPLLTGWQRMDLNAVPKKFVGKVGEIPKPMERKTYTQTKQDAALKHQAETEKNNNRFYSRYELEETQAVDCINIINRMAQSDLGAKLGQFLTVFDQETKGGSRFTSGNEAIGGDTFRFGQLAYIQLRNVYSLLKDVKDGFPPTADRAMEAIGKLRDGAAYFRMAAERATGLTNGKGFVKRTEEGASLVDRLIEKNYVPGVDPLRSYVAFNSGNCTGEIQKNRLECTAKAAAAYEWAAANNYKIGGNIKESEIHKQGVLMQKDPVFLEFFRDTTAKPEQKELDAEEKAKVNSLAIEKCIYRQRHQDLVNQRRHPMSYQAKREDQLAALKELRDLGDVLDHCNGAGKDYKNFFYSLKDLGRLNLDGMSGEELGAELDKIYKFTEKYMKGKKSVSWYKNRREHFEQALDALACIRKVSRFGEKLADKLVTRTNHIREKRHQPQVSLNDRSARKTAERLVASRGLQGTEQSNDIIRLIEAGLKKDKLVKASEVADPAALPALPAKLASERTVSLSKVQDNINTFLQSRGEDYHSAGKNIPEILALSITPAYRNANGNAVMNREQYERNVRVMAQHLVTDQLTSEYRYEENRQALLNHENVNKPAQLRTEFDQKNAVLTQQIKAEDDRQQGDLAGQKDEDVQKREREEQQKRLREKKELEELKRQTEALNKQAEKLGLEKQKFSEANEARLQQLEVENENYQDLNASMLGMG